MALCRRTDQESDVESDWFELGVQWPSVKKEWKKGFIITYILLKFFSVLDYLPVFFSSASMVTLMAINTSLPKSSHRNLYLEATSQILSGATVCLLEQATTVSSSYPLANGFTQSMKYTGDNIILGKQVNKKRFFPSFYIYIPPVRNHVILKFCQCIFI